MNIIPLAPRGFCKGVYLALKLAKDTAKQNPDEQITILGQLVHNRYVSLALEYHNIKTLHNPSLSKEQLLEQIDGGIVIFTAHGISESIKQKALAKGLRIVDATCSDVNRTHTVIKEKLSMGYHVLYIGKNNHPESMAIVENFPSVTLMEIKDDIPNLIEPLFVTNQTTLSKREMEKTIQNILNKYPEATISNDLCSATTLRQQAVEQVHADGLIVVGDPSSNNTLMLASIGHVHGYPWIQRIESVEQLDVSYLKENMSIAVTAGASTPAYLTNQVIEYLKNYDVNHPQPLPNVDISQILE